MSREETSPRVSGRYCAWTGKRPLDNGDRQPLVWRGVKRSSCQIWRRVRCEDKEGTASLRLDVAERSCRTKAGDAGRVLHTSPMCGVWISELDIRTTRARTMWEG